MGQLLSLAYTLLLIRKNTSKSHHVLVRNMAHLKGMPPDYSEITKELLDRGHVMESGNIQEKPIKVILKVF